MAAFSSGPHGAEEEDFNEAWSELALFDEKGTPPKSSGFAASAGLLAQEPYSPAMASGLESDEALPEDPSRLEPPGSNSSRNDPLGSWTGVPDPDTEEIPTQDQDDL